MTASELNQLRALARGAIRAVRESATGRGILGPAALQLADAADVLIAESERMRALLILFRATALSNRERAVAQMHAADGDDTNVLRGIVAGSDEILSRIDAVIGEEMKDCTHCKYAEWERTKNGALHPKGDGRCTYTVKIPPLPALPASQYWAWESQGHPKVLGGEINRHLHLPSHCVYYEKVPR